MSSHHTQCLLLPEFPGPHLPPFWKLLPCQCGQNRVEGPHTQLPLLSQPLLLLLAVLPL